MKPAILNGRPQFEKPLNIVSPKLPSLDSIQIELSKILESGQLTNHAKYVPILENLISKKLGVKNSIAVGNATLGLILALESIKNKGEVILPSFTYCATAHSLYWSKQKPVFVDILPDTFTIDPQDVEAAINSNTVAILAVHIYGHPCEIHELEKISRKYSIPLLFDSAHAFGSKYHGCPIGGFGDLEIFSMHATKVYPVGEGGVITSNNSEVSQFLSLARKFGDPGDENTLFPGMNAKMQEFNAIIGIEMLKVIDQHIANRNLYANYLNENLSTIPGISFQSMRPDISSNYQNFVILVNENQFGISRDMLFTALQAENIKTRKYFYPPLHKHAAYKTLNGKNLPITERVSSEILALPFYSEMSISELEGICLAIKKIQEYSSKIKSLSNL